MLSKYYNFVFFKKIQLTFWVIEILFFSIQGFILWVPRPLLVFITVLCWLTNVVMNRYLTLYSFLDAKLNLISLLQCKKECKFQFIFTDGDSVDMNPDLASSWQWFVFNESLLWKFTNFMNVAKQEKKACFSAIMFFYNLCF